MPHKRQPRQIWSQTRRLVLARDGYACVRCGAVLTAQTAHIDHIKSGKRATNADRNLRALCRRCHVLRIDGRHRGLISAALRDGLIPPEYRPLMWSDDELD